MLLRVWRNHMHGKLAASRERMMPVHSTATADECHVAVPVRCWQLREFTKIDSQHCWEASELD